MYIVTAGCKSMGICKTAVTDERNVCVGGGGHWMCVFLLSWHLCLLLIYIISKAVYKKKTIKK